MGSLAIFTRDLRASVGQRNLLSGKRALHGYLAPAIDNLPPPGGAKIAELM
jgi:hypothetical protein